MAYRAIVEEIQSPYVQGRLVYLIPKKADSSNALIMQAYKNQCLCWMLLEEDISIICDLIKKVGITKATIITIDRFHAEFYDKILYMYHVRKKRQVERILYSMNKYIIEAITDCSKIN